jgi:DNA-directed RNA polymerase subunit RPC12/RpoP
MYEEDDEARCPKCGSAKTHAGGWSAGTAFVASGDTFITCLECGHKFRPRHLNWHAIIFLALVILLSFVMLMVLGLHDA